MYNIINMRGPDYISIVYIAVVYTCITWAFSCSLDTVCFSTMYFVWIANCMYLVWIIMYFVLSADYNTNYQKKKFAAMPTTCPDRMEME